MTTKPKNTYESIAQDATQLHATAVADLHDKTFAKYVDKHELDVFLANASKLKLGAAAQTSKLHEQVGAGVHVATACAALAAVCRSVRDTAELEFLSDASTRNEAIARAFGWGHSLDASNVASVESFAHFLLAGAAAHPKEAAKAHLDAKGLHHLHDLIEALEGTDIAHVQTKANRHDASTAIDSLAHVVAAESAHLRFVAKRVFSGDEARLGRYASTLPRHEVKHRTRHAPAATTTASGTAA